MKCKDQRCFFVLLCDIAQWTSKVSGGISSQDDCSLSPLLGVEISLRCGEKKKKAVKPVSSAFCQ